MKTSLAHVNNLQCFLPGAFSFHKDLAHQKALRAARSPFAGDSSAVLFSQHGRALFTTVADLYLGWKNRVGPGYTGLFLQQFVPAWVFLERRASSKLSAQPGKTG